MHYRSTASSPFQLGLRAGGWMLGAAILLAGGGPTVNGATVQTLEPTPLTGEITAIDHDVLTLTKKGAEAVKVPLGDILEIGITWEDRQARHAPQTAASTAPATKPAVAATQKKAMLWHVELDNGDHFTAVLSNWRDGHDECNLDAVKGTSLQVPVAELRAVWSDASFDALSQVKKAKDLHIASQAQDVAFVQKDGDVKPVAGLVTGLDEDSLHFKFEGEEHTIKLERLVGIMFAQREAATVAGLYNTFTLMNDDVLSARTIGMSNEVFQISPVAEGGTTASVDLPLSALTKVETHNGRLTWVGDMTPLSVSQVPYFDHLMPYQVNKSLTGGPLRLIDGTVTKGIAVHARCVLTYAIDGQYEHFRAKVGFQQPEGKMGHAAVRVLGDEKVLWEDADIKGDGKPAALDLQVAGAKTLTLEVDYGKNQDVGDRVIWGEARLIKPASN